MTDKKPSRAALNPKALAERLGIQEWQVVRAHRDGILPQKDRSAGWSANLSDRIVAEHAGKTTELVDRIGRVPDMATWDVKRQWAHWFEPDEVTTDGVREVARRGLIEVAYHDREYPVFKGRSIEAFMDLPDARALLAEAVAFGRSLTADEAAVELGVRRTDFDHCVRAGLIAPMRIGRTGHWSKSRDPGCPLYRWGDVTALLELPGIDWVDVAATPKGHRSPLAKLPDAVRKDAR